MVYGASSNWRRQAVMRHVVIALPPRQGVVIVIPGYPFRLYASPWKLGFFWVASAVFVALGYQALFQPGAHPDAWHGVLYWVGLVFFGLGVVVFGALLLLLIVARRPLVDITAEGWRYRTHPFYLKIASVAWSEIARIGIYRQKGGRNVTAYLVLILRSEELTMALEDGTPPNHLPTLFTLDTKQIPLTFAFLRVTPGVCERLLRAIQSVCVHEIARYDVYVEPHVMWMM